MDLTILHTADLHNSSALFPLVESYPKDGNTLILDSGDALAGSNTLFFPWEPILGRMGAARYDAMAVGNREFHYLRSVVKKRAMDAPFPLLCANVEDRYGVMERCWKRSHIVEAGGLRIGVTGLTPPQFTDDSFWARLTGVKFLDNTRIARVIDEELGGKADLVIVLSHLGLRHDRELAERLPPGSIILGGHSHQALETPIKAGGTLIFHSGSHGRLLGELKLTLCAESPPRAVETFTWRLVPPLPGGAVKR